MKDDKGKDVKEHKGPKDEVQPLDGDPPPPPPGEGEGGQTGGGPE